MLSITREYKTEDGIVLGKDTSKLFINKSNVEDIYKLLIQNVPLIQNDNGKYSVLFTKFGYKLIDDNGQGINLFGNIVGRVGVKYFICSALNGKYYVIDNNNCLIFGAHNEIRFLGESLAVLKSNIAKKDIVLTTKDYYVFPENQIRVLTSFPNGYWIALTTDKNGYSIYLVFDQWLCPVDKSVSYAELVQKYEKLPPTDDLSAKDSILLYEKHLINLFKKFSDFSFSDSDNLLSLLNQAANSESDFYIDMDSIKLVKTKLVPYLKISDGMGEFWILDNDENMKELNDLCRRRTDKDGFKEG